MWPSRSSSSSRVRTIIDRGGTGDSIIHHIVVQVVVVGRVAILMIVGLQLVVGQLIDFRVLVSAAPGILQMLLFFVSFFADMTDLGGLMFADV